MTSQEREKKGSQNYVVGARTTYLERFGKLFTGNKGMHSSLLRRPSLDRVQIE